MHAGDTAIFCRESIAGLLLHSAPELMDQLMLMSCRVWARDGGRLDQSMQGIDYCDTRANSPSRGTWQECNFVLATIWVCLVH